ncbi:MAG: thiamine phosphate synthase [Pyrinomonadaceae bacterium]
MIAFPVSRFRILITPGLADSSHFSIQRTEILETVELAVAAGIEMVQIREKQLPARPLFDLVREAATLTSGTETRLLVNERFDIALAAGADGVHLTSTSMPVDLVRGSVPPGFIIGVSTHSSEEVATAEESGANYAMLGPIFATPGKDDPIGLDELARVSRAVSPFRVVAVGGIDASNAASVIEAGAEGVAAIRYLNDFVRIGQ